MGPGYRITSGEWLRHGRPVALPPRFVLLRSAPTTYGVSPTPARSVHLRARAKMHRVPDLATIQLFCAATFVLAATPGPGILYVVGRSVDQGRGAGIASMLGIEAGEVVHIVGVAVGLSALIATSATALDLLRFAGAAYLIVIGVRRWREGGADVGSEHAAPASRRHIFAQGFAVQVLNPKVVIFFLAYFPQFLDSDSPVLPQTLVLGAVYICTAASVDAIYVMLSSFVGVRLKSSAAMGRRTAKASGLTYVGLGVAAALYGHGTATRSP